MSLKKRNIPIWAGVAVLYLAFIGFFIFLYPITEDEIICPAPNSDCLIWTLTTVCARFGSVIQIFLINGYKWLFLILGPLAQLGLVTALFYLINLRLPDFKTLKDFPEISALALMCVFLAAQPDQTIFWLSGAANYLFLGLMFICFCALLRKSWFEPDFIPYNKYTAAAAFLIGVILGMNNENSAPMMFCLCALYGFSALALKRPIPKWILSVWAGIALGLIIMFSSPVYYKRSNMDFIRVALNARPLSLKLYNHLANMDLFMASSLYILPVLSLCGLLGLIDKFKESIKNDNFIFFALSCFISLVLALALFPIAIRPHRAFYSASLFTISALFFFTIYVKDIYKFNLMPFVAAGIFVYSAAIFPSFAKPYFNLYRQGQARNSILAQTLKDKRLFCIYLPKYKILPGPSKNLTIDFIDAMGGKHSAAENYYKRKFISGEELSPGSYIM